MYSMWNTFSPSLNCKNVLNPFDVRLRNVWEVSYHRMINLHSRVQHSGLILS